MSILIKGMDMPKNCQECDLYIEGACYAKGYRDYRLIMDKSKPDDCPLIELPPHGDLVDRNELLAEYDRQHEGEAGNARKIMEQGETVIEAEGNET